jgi:hypothetical protein
LDESSQPTTTVAAGAYEEPPTPGPPVPAPAAKRKNTKAAKPSKATPEASSETNITLPDAYLGVPYDVQLTLGCEPNCPQWTISPTAFPDGTKIDTDAAKNGEIKFIAPSRGDGLQRLTLTGTDSKHTRWTLTLNLLANKFVANERGTPATGTVDSPVVLPPVMVGGKYTTTLSLGVDCQTWNAPASEAGALPGGFLSSLPNLTVNGSGVSPGFYEFRASCEESGGGTSVGNFRIEVLGAPPIVAAVAPSFISSYDDVCQYKFNDCDWHYILTGGGEESELSSQSSETTAVVTFFWRQPTNIRAASGWLEARFLGAPNANSTQNLVSAFQTATGSSSTSALSQVGYALDYVIGIEHDWFQPKRNPLSGHVQGRSNPGSGMFTVGPIAYFGATTPLSSQSATIAYQIPAYGTNECNQILARYSSSPYNLPKQPSSPYITTTAVTGGSNPSTTTTTSGPYCIINPVPIATTSGGVTTTVSGTAIQDLAFAPGDRHSFLLKYGLGLRLVNRLTDDQGDYCSNNYPCLRDIVDLVVGQDEAITGGMLRHWVLKTDATIPLWRTNAYFFGSGDIRFLRNQNFTPLVLQPASIVASSPNPPTSITIPSSNTWTLPLVQPNRDFYRIGLGVDLTSVVQNLIKKSP